MKGTFHVPLDPQASTSRRQAVETTPLQTRFTLHENGKMMERPKPGARRVALGSQRTILRPHL